MCRNTETIGANLRRLDAIKAFLAEKNNTPFAVEGLKRFLAIGRVDPEITGMALGECGQIPSFLCYGRFIERHENISREGYLWGLAVKGGTLGALGIHSRLGTPKSIVTPMELGL